MKATTFVASLVGVFAVGTGVLAIDTSGLPPCSLTCLSAAIQGSGCGLTDYLCQCTKGNQTITEQSVPCIQSKCKPPDQTSAAVAATSICKAALASASGTSAGSPPSSATETSGSSDSSSASAAQQSSTGAAAPAHMNGYAGALGAVAVGMLAL